LRAIRKEAKARKNLKKGRKKKKKQQEVAKPLPYFLSPLNALGVKGEEKEKSQGKGKKGEGD